MNEHVFRAYDIRGVADRDLDDAFVTALGRAFGTVVREAGGPHAGESGSRHTRTNRAKRRLVAEQLECLTAREHLHVVSVGAQPRQHRTSARGVPTSTSVHEIRDARHQPRVQLGVAALLRLRTAGARSNPSPNATACTPVQRPSKRSSRGREGVTKLRRAWSRASPKAS